VLERISEVELDERSELRGFLHLLYGHFPVKSKACVATCSGQQRHQIHQVSPMKLWRCGLFGLSVRHLGVIAPRLASTRKDVKAVSWNEGERCDTCASDAALKR